MLLEAALVVLALYVLTKLYRTHNPANKEYMQSGIVPGPDIYPVIGCEAPPTDPCAFAKWVCDQSIKYDGVFRLKVLDEYAVFTSRAEHVEAILANRDNIAKGWVYDYISPWFGNGLLNSSGAEWHSQRKLLTPTFHFQVLADYALVMNEHSQLLVDRIQQLVDEGQPTIDVSRLLGRFTLDIICETAMGRQLNAINNPDNAYSASLRAFTNLAVQRFHRPQYWNHWIYFNLLPAGRQAAKHLKVLKELTTETIALKQRQLAEKQQQGAESADSGSNQKKRRAFLDLLVEMAAAGHIDDAQIQAQTDTFMFAGHDTTSTSLGWLLYVLGRHPDIQRRVQEEIEQVIGNDSADLANMTELKYMEQVIKESQRYLPAVPIISRRVVKPLKLDDNITIPPGVNVSCVLYQLHHNEKHWPEPFKFDPDRFAPENAAGRHPFAFVPFSAGLRNCIGQKFAAQELKIALVYLLRSFNVSAEQSEQQVFDEMEFVLVNRPSKKLLITFEPRV